MADNIIRRFVRIFFDRTSAKQVEKELNDALGKAGEKAGTEFLRELRKSFNKRIADLRVELAKGLISQDEFRKQADIAARQFNAGILKGMAEARKAGTLTEREYEKLSRQLKRVGEEGEGAWDRIRRSGKAALALLGSWFAASRIGSFAREAMTAAMEARQAFAQLEAANKSTGAAAGFTTEQLKKQAEALSLVSRFSSEAIQGGLTRLLTYTEIQGDMFRRASVAALDMAERLGIDVASAAEKVGNALNYPTKALNSLTRQGFRFTEQQTEQIKSMEAAGDIAGAQAIILGELELAYGGAAKAANEALGPWGNLAKTAHRLKENLGEALLRAAESGSGIQKLTGFLDGLADNADRIVSILGSLVKGAVVVSLTTAFARLATAVRSTTISIVALRTAIQATWASLGPAGWFVLGVTAVAGAFEMAASRSRKAAAEMADAVAKMKGELAGLTTAQLEAEAQTNKGRFYEVSQRLDTLRGQQPEVRFGRSGLPLPLRAEQQKVLDEIAAKERELNLIRERGKEIATLRGERLAAALRSEASGAGDLATATGDLAKRQREQFEDRVEQVRQEIEDLRRLREANAAGDPARVAQVEQTLQREAQIRERIKGLTVEQAALLTGLIQAQHQEADALAEVVRHQEMRAQLVQLMRDFEQDDANEARRQQEQVEALQARIAVEARERQAMSEGKEAVAAFNREMFIQESLLRAGAVAGTEFGDEIANLAGQQWDAAANFSAPWTAALTQVENEVQSQKSLFAELGEAWAQGGFAGIAAYAKAKAKENLAAAIEMGAKALGALAIGNPAAAAKAASSALKHSAAAAAWGVAGKVAGGGSSAMAGGGGSAIASSTLGGSSEPPGPEVHIYIDPLRPDDPRAQEFVMGAVNQGRERFGENATVRIHRRTR